MATAYAFFDASVGQAYGSQQPGSLLTTTQITDIKTPIINEIDADFVTAMNGAESGSMNTLTYGMLLARNETIAETAKGLAKNNLRATKGGASDTYARQGEINEWEAQNKLDTLFFLQILFIYFVMIVGLLYARKYAGIPPTTFYIFFGVLTAILVGIIWNRAAYTTKSRDKRYWNRRFIGLTDGGLKANASCA